MSEAELPLGFNRMNRFRQSLPLSRSTSQTKLRSPGTIRAVLSHQTSTTNNHLCRQDACVCLVWDWLGIGMGLVCVCPNNPRRNWGHCRVTKGDELPSASLL